MCACLVMSQKYLGNILLCQNLIPCILTFCSAARSLPSYSFLFFNVYGTAQRRCHTRSRVYQFATRMLDTLYSVHSSHTHSFVDHRTLELQ